MTKNKLQLSTPDKGAAISGQRSISPMEMDSISPLNLRKHGLGKSISENDLQDWQRAFSAFDTDGSGAIDFGELKQVIKRNKIDADYESLEKSFDIWMVDTDGSGVHVI
jgi:hypothetical protein